jgi:hypothetical protein
VRRSSLLGLAALAGCTAPVQQAPEGSLESAPEADVESLFQVQGTVTDPEEIATEQDGLEVGVLWLNRLDSGEVLVAATPAYSLGTTLPASFDVSVFAAPSDALLGNYLFAYSEGGAQIEAVDRDRVGFGVVVVGTTGTLASLPSSTTLGDFIADRTGSSGLLGQFTYVSPYTVRYVEGASAENLTLRDINGASYTVDDLGLIDVRGWVAGVNTSVCRDDALGLGWQEPEVLACIEAGRADADRTSQDIENTCLYAWFEANAAAVDAECGTIDFVAADFRNARRVAPGEEILLTLGEDDARVALGNGGFTFID